MKNKLHIILIAIILSVLTPFSLFSQKSKAGANNITSLDLEGHVSFLASPLLKGRMNGDDGLEIASIYVASQAKMLGLKPANGNSYFQPYSIIKRSIDPVKTTLQVISADNEPVTIKESILQWLPEIASNSQLKERLFLQDMG